MASYNQVTLIGRLTRDPDLRYTHSGKSVCSFSLAVDKFRKEDGADFFECEAWEKAAEIIQKYCKKGSPLFVVGRGTFDKWERDNVKHTRFKVIVDRFQLLPSKKDDAPARPAPVDRAAEKNAQGQPAGPEDFSSGADEFNVEEIPF